MHWQNQPSILNSKQKNDSNPIGDSTMFTMRNPIDDYAPLPSETLKLDSGEYHHFSFMITEVEKQLFNYKPQPTHRHLCHITSNRLILEPQAKGKALLSPIAHLTTPNHSTYSIPYDRIQSLIVVRSLNFAPSVKLTLKPAAPGQPNTDLTFVANPTPQGRIENPAANRSTDFVELTNMMLQVDETFIQEIQHSPVPVMVYFWAAGCKPCEIFAPTVDTVIEQFGDRLKLVKVNMDDDPSLPMRYGVNTIPTVLLFKSGTIVDKVDGAIPAALFAKVIGRHLSMANAAERIA
jgi:thioredoxin 1